MPVVPTMPEAALPPRGFAETEFEERTRFAQTAMLESKLDAILLTTEPEIRYFTGFQTQFFESPTRPWFVLVPLSGKPIAVIPGLGLAGMRATWIDDVRTWQSPCPEDDGITLLADTLNGLPARFGQLGLALGQESTLRMPVRDSQILAERIALSPVDCAKLLLKQRFVKSQAEVAKIRAVCQLTSAEFEALPQYTSLGESERQIGRRMRINLLARGADSTPFLVAGSGPGGYDNIIMGPTDRQLGEGDVLIIDTGTTFDGYFCDFDRNFAFGHIADDPRKAHATVYRATDAGFAAARPGATMADVWRAMWEVLENGGALGNSVGRMGHGLGMQLTEWPSVKEDDLTLLTPGAVITLEPGMEFAADRQLVHEENIVITEDGAEYLTRRAPAEMPVVS